MPFHPVHPDPEQLAAWQAGELPAAGGGRIEAHVAGCADCAGVVSAVQRGRAALAGLAEVDMPAGLHERLAAAIEHEVSATAGAGIGDLDRRRHRGRRLPAGRRRIAALSTAAAVVVLLVAGLVPLLSHVGRDRLATQTAGGGAASAAKGPGGGSSEGSLPVFSAPDGYSASALRSMLSSDPLARFAYQRAAAGSPGVQRSGADQPTPVAPQLDAQGDSGGPEGTARGAARTAKSTPAAQAPSGVQQLTCVANARNQAGNQGLRPAFFVDTTYRGRPATLLVTVRPGASDQADLWAFPRGNCSAPPFAHDRVTVTPP